MNDYYYIPIQNIYIAVKNRLIRAELTKEKTNLWGVKIPSLPYFTIGGNTKQETVENIQSILQQNVRKIQYSKS